MWSSAQRNCTLPTKALSVGPCSRPSVAELKWSRRLERRYHPSEIWIFVQHESTKTRKEACGPRHHQVLAAACWDCVRAPAPAFGGATVGSLLAIAAAQLIRSSLFATKPLDPAVFAGVIGLLLGVATTACLIPAWRATRVQPATVLRSE